MLQLALRQLRFELWRSLLTCTGIAAVLAVILVLQGFRQGMREQLRDVALDRGAELIVTQAGIENMVGSRSVIPQEVRSQVEAVAGVRTANPMTTIPLIYEKDGRKSPIFLVVIDSMGGPQHVLAGRHLEGDGEILIDRSIAKLYGLKPSDDFTIAGYTFTVVGVVDATAALWTPFAFSNYGSLIEFYFESDLASDISTFPLVSYLLIAIEPTSDPKTVAALIEESVADVDVFLPAALAHNDSQLGDTMFGAVISVLVGVAYATGLLVIALFMFANAEGRRRDLSILKAVGFANRSIATSIVAETLALTIVAAPLGIALASLVASFVEWFTPVYRILPAVPIPMVTALVGCGVFALLGAFAPLTFIRSIEPVEVFQT